MTALLPEDATQEVGNNYGKDPLSAYKETSDPDKIYYPKDTKADNRK